MWEDMWKSVEDKIGRLVDHLASTVVSAEGKQFYAVVVRQDNLIGSTMIDVPVDGAQGLEKIMSQFFHRQLHKKMSIDMRSKFLVIVKPLDFPVAADKGAREKASFEETSNAEVEA